MTRNAQNLSLFVSVQRQVREVPQNFCREQRGLTPFKNGCRDVRRQPCQREDAADTSDLKSFAVFDFAKSAGRAVKKFYRRSFRISNKVDEVLIRLWRIRRRNNDRPRPSVLAFLERDIEGDMDRLMSCLR